MSCHKVSYIAINNLTRVLSVHVVILIYFVIYVPTRALPVRMVALVILCHLYMSCRLSCHDIWHMWYKIANSPTPNKIVLRTNYIMGVHCIPFIMKLYRNEYTFINEQLYTYIIKSRIKQTIKRCCRLIYCFVIILLFSCTVIYHIVRACMCNIIYTEWQY